MMKAVTQACQVVEFSVANSSSYNMDSTKNDRTFMRLLDFNKISNSYPDSLVDETLYKLNYVTYINEPQKRQPQAKPT